LKPANLFLVPLPVAMPGLPEEYVKVLDFGIAKMTSSETLTNAMGLLGTVHYMAPEQIEGVDEIDGRADQFALACICYELLAGKKPFASDTAEGVIYSIVNTQPRSLQAVVDKAVEGVILRGLSKNRSERYPNVRAFATALREASRATADDSPPPARPSAKEANTEGSLSLSALVAAGTKTVLDKTTSVTFKRRAGAALALLSTFGLGLFVMRRFTASASAGAGKATPDTAALVEAVRARVQQTLDDELKTVASVVHVARRIPELRNAARFQVDAVTFGDLFASEEWWLPYRGLSVVVLNGERQLVARNVGDQTDPRAWKLWVKAPGRDINSGIVIGNDQAYLAAGAGIDDKGAYGLVVGKPLNAIRLRRLTKLSDVARIVVTDGKRVFSWPEDATSDSLGQLLIEATDKGRTDLGLPDGRIAIALRRPVGVSLWAVVEDDPNH
ncbi:MAG TPA: protein kinase, partial [Polyangia bacterium]